MSMRFFISALLPMLLFTHSALSQNEVRPYGRIDLRPGIGFNMGTRHTKTITPDYLINFDMNSVYWQIFAGSFYITKHFGLEISMHGSNINNHKQQTADYENYLNEKYSNQYFITTTTKQPHYGEFLFVGDQESFRFGPVYRYQQRKLQYKAKLLIGTERIDANPSTIRLKEKGTNQITEIDYRASQQYQETFAITPSLSVGYRFAGRFLINIDLAYSYSKANFVYKETITNLDANTEEVNTYPYNFKLHKVSIGTGITVEFGKIKPRTKQSPASL
ncbi:hypothetical protein Oweho_3116 [Owenweeksia hongkongensis DSM 17368]|uniref:Outer membrane protein beta-barrel domain-containing protein n=2 Tax=Owenweeksia TaxID=267986 RepID=G8R345_OWEHD|nr:hypothetical protein Oweho_3116 [Owenweeksia hongkongensis DSM 17368]